MLRSVFSGTWHWQWTARRLQTLMNWYPPFVGAGVKVVTLANDFRYAKVQMPLTWYNRNIVGVHFGGSLYAMCDPVYMLLLMHALNDTNRHGPHEFVVWDQAASIQYLQPGRGTVTAEFILNDALLQRIRTMEPGTKQTLDLGVDVRDEAGNVVARLVKTEYIRRLRMPLRPNTQS
uniref:Thioesterase n=1 Tax=Phaeodactylum tricornutum TaxID=2850 RepID=A0A8J9TFA7_PHATR